MAIMNRQLDLNILNSGLFVVQLLCRVRGEVSVCLRGKCCGVCALQLLWWLYTRSIFFVACVRCNCCVACVRCGASTIRRIRGGKFGGEK